MGNCGRIYAPENVFYRLKGRNLKKTFFTLLGKKRFDVHNNLAKIRSRLLQDLGYCKIYPSFTFLPKPCNNRGLLTVCD